MSNTISSCNSEARSYIIFFTEPNLGGHINDYPYLTPPRVASAYNIPASTGANVKVGIISLGGGWSASDFNKSMSDLGLSSLITSSNITTVGVDKTAGWTSTSNLSYDQNTFDGAASSENTLDLYCVAGMAPKANIVLYIGTLSGPSYGTTNPAITPSQNLVTGFGNVINRAVSENCDIITVSWGQSELFVNSGTTYYFGDWLAAPLANAAAQGITVLVATGDNGSEPFASSNFEGVQYPATSANVIAVGGTNLQTNYAYGNVRLSETVEYHDGFSNTWGGGGGVSTTIPLPSWQANLSYTPYFQANSTAGSLTTLTKRGIPDISAAMNAYSLYSNGTIATVGGTSAAAPIMAGMFARFMSLNDGRRPIPNAIHSILYNNLDAYYDITTGNNATVQYLNGYAASSNWDPVTGVGVPWGNVVYQMVSSGGTTVKTATNTWSYLANVKVKTAPTTWSNVKAIWTKTINGWSQTF